VLVAAYVRASHVVEAFDVLAVALQCEGVETAGTGARDSVAGSIGSHTHVKHRLCPAPSLGRQQTNNKNINTQRIGDAPLTPNCVTQQKQNGDIDTLRFQDESSSAILRQMQFALSMPTSVSVTLSLFQLRAPASRKVSGAWSR
jgi:hypothetical protein